LHNPEAGNMTPFALSLSKGVQFMVRQAHHERTNRLCKKSDRLELKQTASHLTII